MNAYSLNQKHNRCFWFRFGVLSIESSVFIRVALLRIGSSPQSEMSHLDFVESLLEVQHKSKLEPFSLCARRCSSGE